MAEIAGYELPDHRQVTKPFQFEAAHENAEMGVIDLKQRTPWW